MAAIFSITTPGIASNIATHLSPEDCALKGLFVLTNDARYRHELVPFTEPLKKEHERKILEQDLQLFMLNELKPIMANIYSCQRGLPRLVPIKQLYAFLFDNIDSVHLLGKKFGTTMCERHCAFLTELENADMYDEYDELDSYEGSFYTWWDRLGIEYWVIMGWPSSEDSDTDIEDSPSF